MKKCTICKITKKLSEFYKNNRTKDGLSYKCKKCAKKYQKENKEAIKKYLRMWRKINKGYHKKYNKKYYQKHKKELVKKLRKYNNNYAKTHKEEKKLYSREYRQKNKDKIKKYYLKNKVKLAKKRKEYKKKNKIKIFSYYYNRRINEPNFKLLDNLRTRMYNALKRNSKSAKTIDLIGCSINQLKQYLESKFKKGMIWNNYGLYGWHIDHIKPCCTFDLSKKSEQKKCFHYTNLQPLWAEENLKKATKYEN